MTLPPNPNRTNIFEELDPTRVGLCLEALDFVIAEHCGDDDAISLELCLDARQRIRAKINGAGLIRGLVATEDVSQTVGYALGVLCGREITAIEYSVEPDPAKLKLLEKLSMDIPSDEAIMWVEQYLTDRNGSEALGVPGSSHSAIT